MSPGSEMEREGAVIASSGLFVCKDEYIPAYDYVYAPRVYKNKHTHTHTPCFKEIRMLWL